MFPIDIDFSRLKEVLTYDPQAPMIFSSGIFLWLFAAFMIVYTLLQRKYTARILFVTLFSYYFYYKSSGTYFFLLALVGGNMIKEALSGEEESATPDLSAKAMLPLAVATSIDALAVGISLAMTEAPIFTSVIVIGITTFALSALGVTIGGIFGNKFQKKAEIFGGVVLILLGCKILLESLGIF